MIYKVTVLYILFWTILSEDKSLETIILGILISLIVSLFNKEFFKDSSKKININKLKYWTKYVLILIREIIISNFHVAKIVLSPHIKISPTVVTFTTKLNTNFYRTILANSITLTPGTLTVAMEGNRLTIHCLEKECVEGLIDSDFEKILLKVEGESL